MKLNKKRFLPKSNLNPKYIDAISPYDIAKAGNTFEVALKPGRKDILRKIRKPSKIAIRLLMIFGEYVFHQIPRSGGNP